MHEIDTQTHDTFQCRLIHSCIVPSLHTVQSKIKLHLKNKNKNARSANPVERTVVTILQEAVLATLQFYFLPGELGEDM